MFIPLFEEEDRPVWEGTFIGTLKLKEDYSFLNGPSHDISWAKMIWIGTAVCWLKPCFASKVRDWLEIKLQHKLDQNSMLNILGVLNFDYSPQLHDVRLVTINYIVWSIWDYRHQQVRWQPPIMGWVKCNTDEATKGSLGIAGCGEISAVITTIEIAHEKGWRNLWLECDSLMVVQDFKDVNLVPWSLRNTWRNAVIRLEI
ncbi:hypothetical protein glysoja_039337 [Glycine soja]|uniref:Uncharacterized protein n=1 Tax=Glycine soja TaxID=3848 RepID=A0A0B2NVD7_GLYSO|nr:hypothetical protein glysoja_039337 [Glycine soja]